MWSAPVGQGLDDTSPSGSSDKARFFRPRRLLAGVAIVAVVIAGSAALLATRYTREARANANAAAQAAGVPVSVGMVKPQSVHPFAEFSGRITAVDFAEIRPQV